MGTIERKSQGEMYTLLIQEKLRAYRIGGPGRFKAQAAHRGEIQRETIGQEALWVVKGRRVFGLSSLSTVDTQGVPLNQMK